MKVWYENEINRNGMRIIFTKITVSEVGHGLWENNDLYCSVKNYSKWKRIYIIIFNIIKRSAVLTDRIKNNY